MEALTGPSAPMGLVINKALLKYIKERGLSKFYNEDIYGKFYEKTGIIPAPELVLDIIVNLISINKCMLVDFGNMLVDIIEFVFSNPIWNNINDIRQIMRNGLKVFIGHCVDTVYTKGEHGNCGYCQKLKNKPADFYNTFAELSRKELNEAIQIGEHRRLQVATSAVFCYQLPVLDMATFIYYTNSILKTYTLLNSFFGILINDQIYMACMDKNKCSQSDTKEEKMDDSDGKEEYKD